MVRESKTGAANAPEATDADPELAVMARNGITRVAAHHYDVDGYRYAKLADALSQVQRGAADRSRL